MLTVHGRLCVRLPQKRMNLSQKQLQALMQTRRRLLTDIGTLLAEREQLAAKIRVRMHLLLRRSNHGGCSAQCARH